MSPEAQPNPAHSARAGDKKVSHIQSERTTSDVRTMDEHRPDFVRPMDPFAGTQSRPRDSSSSSSSSSNISSTTSSAMTSNIAQGDEDEDTSLSISISTASLHHQEASVCSRSSRSSSNTDKPTAHRTNHGGCSTTSPSPPSSSPYSFPSEVYEFSSDGDQGEEEEEEGGVDSAVDKVFALFEQGQDSQESILVDLARKGEVAQRVGRRMADEAYTALKQGQREKATTAGRVEGLLGYLTHRLEKCQRERRELKREKDRLRSKLHAKQKKNITLETLSARMDRAQQHLEAEEAEHTDLKKEHGRLIICKKKLEEANRGLKADVAFLEAVQRRRENNRPVDVAQVARRLREVEAQQEEIVKSRDTLVADKQRLQEANSHLQAGIASLTERLAAVTVAEDTSSAVSETATAGMDLLAASTATPSLGSVGPVASPTERPPPPPTDTTAAAANGKDKAASSWSTKAPSRPRAGADRPTATATFDATVPVGKVVPSASAVTTTPSRQQTPPKTRKSGGGQEGMSKRPHSNMHSPSVEKGLKAAYGTPRQYPGRPLYALGLDSGGKGAAGGKTPIVTAQSKSAPKRGSSIGKEGVPSLAVRAVAKPALNGSGSVGKGVPSLAARAVTKPSLDRTSSIGMEGPSLTTQGEKGGADKQGSVAKGPTVKGARGGGARTDRLSKAKGAGGGGKVEVAASGRVLRSASRTAAAGAVGDPSPVQPTRSTRSTTRRPAPNASTTGRGLNDRGKYMSF